MKYLVGFLLTNSYSITPVQTAEIDCSSITVYYEVVSKPGLSYPQCVDTRWIIAMVGCTAQYNI